MKPALVGMAEAKGKDKVAKAEFEYRHKRTGKTRYEVNLAKANADEVAREKSDAMTGGAEVVGVKEAKAADTAAKADVKAQTKIQNANEIADEKPAKARTKA